MNATKPGTTKDRTDLASLIRQARQSLANPAPITGVSDAQVAYATKTRTKALETCDRRLRTLRNQHAVKLVRLLAKGIVAKKKVAAKILDAGADVVAERALDWAITYVKPVYPVK